MIVSLSGATTDATRDYNIEAKIADDNQYYINFFRKTRRDVYHTYGKNNYEAGNPNSGSWEKQDPDDWDGKVGYADHVDIVDDLGLIVPDPVYDYDGTLTTALQFHKQIANYFKDDDTAIELTLGTGTTQADQNNSKITYKLKKSDLKKSGDYYVIRFNNDNDKLSDSDAADKELKLKDGVLYLEKNQYVLSFKAKMYDIQGNGEYNSEIKINITIILMMMVIRWMVLIVFQMQMILLLMSNRIWFTILQELVKQQIQ